MLLTRKAVMAAGFFYFWASRRGLGGDASKRRKHTLTDQRRETLPPPAAPSGFPLQCFWHPSSYGRMRYVPTNTTCTGVSHTPSCQKHFHFNPSRTPVRDIITFRGEPSNPLARTLIPRREPRDPAFSQKKWERHPPLATDMQPLTRLERGSVCAHPRRLRPRQEKLYMGQELMCFVDFYRFSAKYTFVINN